MRSAGVVFFAAVVAISNNSAAGAQVQTSISQGYVQYGEPPVMDNEIFYHLLFNQLEGPH